MSQQYELIYLEPDEEIPSIIDRLKKTPASNLRLVTVRGSILTQSQVNLQLLINQAQRLDKAVSLVTSDPVAQKLASRVGLTVFGKPKDNLPLEFNQAKNSSQDSSQASERPADRQDRPSDEEARTQDYDRPDLNSGFKVTHFQHSGDKQGQNGQSDQDRPSQAMLEASQLERPSSQPVSAGSKPRPRAWRVLAVLLVLISAGLVLLVLPQASVSLRVIGQPFETVTRVTVLTDSSSQDQAPTVLGKLVEISASAIEKGQATGQKNVGTKASGTVTLFNAWSSEAQTLAAGTSLVKDSQEYVLTSATTIPGATVTLVSGKTVTTPGQTTGSIEAKQAGAAGNVKVGRFVIPNPDSDRQEKIYAEISKALSGGLDKFVTVVSQADLEGARISSQNNAQAQLKQEAAKQLKETLVLDKASKIEVVDEKSSKKEGDEASEFDFTTRSSMKAIIFSASDFRPVFLKAVSGSAGEGKELIIGPDDEISMVVESLDFEIGRMVVLGKIKAQVADKLDTQTLASLVAGKSKIQAKQIIEDQTQTEDSEIRLSYSLLSRMPFLARNIKFSVEHK